MSCVFMDNDNVHSNKLNVLYIDDEKGFCELTRLYIQRRNKDIKVHIAYSAEEALELLRGRSFDAIISDYQMPGMDGVSFLKNLRSSEDSTPFILFTGKGREEVAVEAFENGADFYIQKGGDPESQYAELVHKIHQAVNLHRARKELQENEERYHSLFEESRDAIWFTSKEGRIIEANKASINLLGYPKEEFLGMDARQLYADPKDRDFFVKSVLEKGFVKDYEVTLRRKDGRDLLCTFTSHVWRNKKGKLLGYRGIVHDITESRRVQEALRKSEERYRLITEHMTGDNVSLVDFSFNVIYSSPSIAKIYGYKAEEVLGQSLDKILTADMQNKVFSAIAELISRESTTRSDRSITIGGEVIHKNGSMIQIEATISFLRSPNGAPTSIIVVSRDISDRKRVENALYQANKKLNILSSITRHDVNNKLTALKGYLELSMAQTEDERLRSYLLQADENVRAIRELIAFTKVYENMGSMKPFWQDLGKILEPLSFPGGEFVTRPCQGISIFADPMLKRVFAMLVDNAIRHGRSVKKIVADVEKTQEGLVISIEDDGIGIPYEEKDVIFNRGYGKNTGLGLFLAKEILAITGICLRETGIPGNGARFEILVPKGSYKMPDDGTIPTCK